MKKKFLLTFLLLSNTFVIFAQGPGGFPTDDPDCTDCPLDTWVIGFAAIALIVTTIYLYKKQTNAAKLSTN